MPLYEFTCAECGQAHEILVYPSDPEPKCPECGGHMVRLMSATSSLTGQPAQGLPGPGDTGCCGSAPGTGGCAGPGSCCGRG